MDMEMLGVGLELSVTGMTVVFIALLMLVGVVTLFKRLGEQRQAKPAEPSAATKTAAPPAPAAPAGSIPPHLIIVLAAAASEMMGQPVRVTRIRYRQLESDVGWARQGRIGIMAGHQNVQRKTGDK